VLAVIWSVLSGHLFSIDVREDTALNSVIAIFRADDPDGDGPNSRVSFSLEPPMKEFIIDEEYGWLMLAGEGLDRETRDRYCIRTCASDEQGLKTCQNSSIRVLDVNDNPPIFGQAKYQVKMGDSSLNMSLLELKTTVYGYSYSVRDSNQPNL